MNQHLHTFHELEQTELEALSQKPEPPAPGKTKAMIAAAVCLAVVVGFAGGYALLSDGGGAGSPTATTAAAARETTAASKETTTTAEEAVPAVPVSGNGFEIEERDGGYVLTGYTGEGGAVTIPEGVTEIGDYSLDDCDKLTVHCPKGSTAENFCKENNIKYVTTG